MILGSRDANIAQIWVNDHASKVMHFNISILRFYGHKVSAFFRITPYCRNNRSTQAYGRTEDSGSGKCYAINSAKSPTLNEGSSAVATHIYARTRDKYFENH